MDKINMTFEDYKRLALQWAREQALNDPTFEFGPTQFALTIETPNPKGEFEKTSGLITKLHGFFKILVEQSVLVKTRYKPLKIGNISYSQDLYSFKDIDNKIILNLLNIKSSGETKQTKSVKKSINTEEFETSFSTYTKVKFIKEGGSGSVYLVKNDESSFYALKILKPESKTSKKIKRFKNELNFCLKCEHEGIVKVIDFGYREQNGNKCLFYIMPFYDKTLRNLIDEGLEPDKIFKYSMQILSALEYAHKYNVWHRDIKPENILYNSENDLLVIADFGIAHFEQDFLITSIETNDERVANFQYAAWEQKTKGAIIDGRADLFAFGLILNEMFTKKVIHGTSFAKIGDVYPEYSSLDDLVEKLISQSPEKRPTSAEDVRYEIIAKVNIIDSRKTEALLERNKCIKPSKINDRIYTNPITIKSFEVDESSLIYKLNQSVNDIWWRIFEEVTNARRVKEMGTVWFEPHYDEIHYDSNSQQNYQKITDDLKKFIVDTNNKYHVHLEEECKEKETSRLKDIQAKILLEKRKQSIMRKVKL